MCVCVCSAGQEGVRPRVGLAEVPRGGASVGVALDAAEGRSGALPRRARLPAHQVLLVLSGLTSGSGGGGSGGDSGSGSRCGGFGSVGLLTLFHADSLYKGKLILITLTFVIKPLLN